MVKVPEPDPPETVIVPTIKDLMVLGIESDSPEARYLTAMLERAFYTGQGRRTRGPLGSIGNYMR